MSGYYAFSFTGPTNGGLDYPTPPQWAGPASFTVSFWMRATPAANVDTWILDVGSRGNYEGVQWTLSQTPKPPLQAHFGFWGDPAYQNVFPFTPWVGKWVHIATVFAAPTRTLTTYVNGQEQVAASKTFPASNKLHPRQAGRVTIGHPAAGSWRTLPGLIDEVRIWDAPLPPDQIRAQMYQRLSLPQEHLISYVNVPAPFSVDVAARPASNAAAALGTALACRDLVTNEKVQELGPVALVPSAVPTGGQVELAGEGEVVVFQAPSYQGHSWRFLQAPHEFDVRADLSRCDVGSVRVGDHTATRIFAEASYAGLSQETLSDLPTLTATRLAASKKTALSLQVASTRGRPPQGAWAIASSAGPYLSAKPEEGGALPLRTSSGVDDEGRFRVEVLGTRDGSQEVSIQSPAHTTYLTAADDGRLVFRDPQVTERSRWVMAAEPGAGRFTLGTADGRRVASRNDAGFELTADAQRQEVFTQAFRSFADEGQVGELPAGSVAFYEEPSYWGRAWVFPAAQADLRLIKGLSVKSLRLGPETGVTLFDRAGFADTGNATDVVHDTPDLRGSTFKGAQITSFKTWGVVSPGAIGLEVVTTLSQDYRTVQGKTEPFCAYRASLGLPQNVAAVEVGVTDRATLEVSGQRRDLGAGESWTVPVNPFGRIIVTAEASHLFCAGLTIRTDTMSGAQRIVLFPDEEPHARLAGLEGDALWQARDHSGKRLLKDGVTQAGAAQVQSAVKAMMGATDYSRTSVNVKDQGAPARDQGAPGAGAAAWQWTSSSRTITQRRMEGEGWILDLGAVSGSPTPVVSDPQTAGPDAPGFRVLSAAQVTQLWGTPTASPKLAVTDDFFDSLWNEGKKIVHVIVKKVAAAAEQIAVQIRYIGNEVREFVISTVTQAAAVAERIFHEVVTSVASVVQWLAYLFDWDAILATQKELADGILGALDFAAAAVRAQQQPVDRGITAFRGQIRTLLEDAKARLKTSPLGIADKRRQSAAARQPSAEEKLHWFLGKTAPQGRTTGLAAASTALADAPKAELQGFFDSLREAAGRIVDKDVRAAFSQAFECFVGAFTDPNAGVGFDQLLEGLLSVLEAIAEAAINVVKVVVDLLFALVDKLLGWVKSTLTAEISIPGLTDLWHQITKGAPFNLLTVTTLAVAIPTTVIRKLVMQPTPVDRGAATDASIAGLRVEVVADSAGPDYGKKLGWAIAYSCFALVNGVVSIPLDAMAAGELIAEPAQDTEMTDFAAGAKPAMPTKPGWASTNLENDSLFEWIAWVTGAGMLVSSWPGGYLNFRHEFFPDNDPTEGWGSVLWIYEGGLTVIDLVALLSPLQKKMRRGGEVELVVASVLGFGHLVLVLVVMGLELAHKSDWYKTHVVPWTTVQGGLGALSESLAFLMLPKLTVPSEGTTLLAYLATEGAAILGDVGINLRLGIGGLIDPIEPR